MDACERGDDGREPNTNASTSNMGGGSADNLFVQAVVTDDEDVVDGGEDLI